MVTRTLAMLLCIAVYMVISDANNMNVDAADCTASSKLQLQYLNKTTDVGAKPVSCMDGTDAGYYIDFPSTYTYVNPEENIEDIPQPILTPPPNQRKYIIWLGEGDLCSGDDCTNYCDVSTTKVGGVCYGIPEEVDSASAFTDEVALCFLRRFTCSSKEWKRVKRVVPETILCHNEKFFGQFVRVFIPMCTLDWFLGTGDPTNSKSTRFRGANLMQMFFETMIRKYEMDKAETLIIGGTLGGAIGALNHVKRIRSWLPNLKNLMVVADSAYFFDFEGFSVKSENVDDIYVIDNLMRNRTKDWLTNAYVDPACKSFWTDQLHRCLIASILAPNFLQNERIMFLQSQYDLVVLAQLDILSEKKKSNYVDLPSYAYALVSYIESWGAGIRGSIIDAAALAAANNTGLHTYYSTGCPQNGYIAPTRYHALKSQVREIGSAGSLKFERGPNVWDTVKIGDMTMHAAVEFWATNNGAMMPYNTTTEDVYDFPYNVRGDTCGSFLCNPTCTSDVYPFKLKDIWPACMQNMVLAFAFIMVLFMWGAFFISYWSVRKFRSVTGKYWKDIIAKQTAANAVQPTANDPKLLASTSNRDSLDDVASQVSGTPDNYVNPAYKHQSKIATPEGDEKKPVDEYADAQEQLLREAAESEYRKVHLMVRDLCYWAPPAHKGASKYQILRNVSLAFTPGTMHALMGPSGSGKSTLLDVMALIRDTGEISGNHYINGVESHKPEASFLREWLRNNVSYVRQTDVLFPLITVREHLTHAAWLMLPEYMNAERKLKRVMQVIKLLELERCADTICGDGGVKIEGGISGGQRRRVSVAAQLLRLPAAMLLDEPTSGLDSTSALTLVRALSTLAHRGGVNIAMTIHQPRQEIFELFDALTILVAGRIVYSGPPKDSAPHFGVSPSEKNISNEILDHLSKVSVEKVAEYRKKYEDGPLGQVMIEGMNKETTVFTSEMAGDLQAVLLENALAEGRWSWSSPTSAPTQTWVLLSRTMLRGGFGILKTAILAMIGGVVVGLCFFGIGTYTSKTALCYLSVTTMTFLQGTFLGDRYLAEKEMYDHEANAGSSTSWQAFLGNQFVRDSVTSAIEGLCFGIPCYWIGGMNPLMERFRLYIVIVILISLNCISQNVFVEVWQDNLRKAALVNVSLVGLGALFNGFIIRLDDLPVYFEWIPYVMITYWGFVAILINDFAGFVFGSCDGNTKLECATKAGDVIVYSLSYSDRDVNIAIFSITCMIVGLRSLACLVFYRQYVHGKGNQMKRVTATDEQGKPLSEFEAMQNQISKATGSLINTATNLAHSGAVAGSAMQSMLANKSDNAKTALKEKKKEARAGGATDPSQLQKQDSYSSANSGVPGTPAQGEGKEFVFHNEWENVKEESEAANGLNEKYGCMKKILLSRVIMMIIFFVDLALGSITCMVTAKDVWLYVYYGLNGLFLAIFAAQYATSVLSYIPYSPDGYLDCIWNGFRDSICAVATLGDAVLFVQTFISDPFSVSDRAAADANVLLIFAFGMRATRLLRVLVFWSKVTRYHQIRAKHWMKWNDEYQALKRLEQSGVDITKTGTQGQPKNDLPPGLANIPSLQLAPSSFDTKPSIPTRPSPPSFLQSIPASRPASGGRSRPVSERLMMANMAAMSGARGPLGPPNGFGANGAPAAPPIPPRADFGNAWAAFKPAIPPR